MLNLRAYASDIATVLLTFNRIQVARASTQADILLEAGTFTNLGSVITLSAGVESYTYTDTGGASGMWYATRYYHSVSLAASAWSAPFEGAPAGVISAAEFRDYDLADLFNADGTPVTDDQLDRHISTATRLCEAEARTTWSAVQSTERHPWRPRSRRVYPFERPIVSVSSLIVEINASTHATFDMANVYVNYDANYIEVTSLSTAAYSLMPAVVSMGLIEPVAVLTYVHGYATIPEYVKAAVALTTSSLLAERRLMQEGMAPGVSSFSLGDYSVSRGTNRTTGEPAGWAVPAAALKLLSRNQNSITLR